MFRNSSIQTVGFQPNTSIHTLQLLSIMAEKRRQRQWRNFALKEGPKWERLQHQIKCQQQKTERNARASRRAANRLQKDLDDLQQQMAELEEEMQQMQERMAKAEKSPKCAKCSFNTLKMQFTAFDCCLSQKGEEQQTINHVVKILAKCV